MLDVLNACRARIAIRPRRWVGALAAALTAMSVLVAAVLVATGAGAQTAASQPAAEARPLTVVTIERRPFSFRAGEGYAGFSIDLWREVAASLDRKFVVEEAKTFPEMLARITAGTADVAIANITITSARERTMDFSHPMFDAGLQVMTIADGGGPTVIGALFTWDMLGLIALAAVVLFAIANLMWLLERHDQEYFHHPYKEGVWRSFWWALNVMLNGGFEERVPRTRSGRMFAVLLVVASLFVVSAFVAKLTAALTVGELKSGIESYADLYGRRVGTTAGSTAAEFLRSHSIQAREYATLPELLKALDAREIEAVVHDAPLLDHYALTEGRGRVEIIGGLLRPEKYGIAMPEGSPLLEPVNRALLRLGEDGTYERLRARWFGSP